MSEYWDDQNNLVNMRNTISKMAEMLLTIGYPKRGSDAEDWDLDDIVKYIQVNFTLDELADKADP